MNWGFAGSSREIKKNTCTQFKELWYNKSVLKMIMNKKTQVFLNERVLKFREVLLIDSDGKSHGVISAREALNIAKSQGLDLFLVSPNANPVVCKVVDYGHLKYEEDKRAKLSAKPKQDTKEIKISPRIQQHDLDTFIKRAKGFLEHGDKVRLKCVFKSREIEHPHLGDEKIKIILSALSEIGLAETEPILQGKVMSLIVNPVKK